MLNRYVSDGVTAPYKLKYWQIKHECCNLFFLLQLALNFTLF